MAIWLWLSFPGPLYLYPPCPFTFRVTSFSATSWTYMVAPALKMFPPVNHIENKEKSLAFWIPWFHGSFHHLNFLPGMPQGRGRQKTKYQVNLVLEWWRRRCPFVLIIPQRSQALWDPQLARICLALSTPLSGFLSFSDLNFLSVSRKRKPEEIKHVISTHYFSHVSSFNPHNNPRR